MYTGDIFKNISVVSRKTDKKEVMKENGWFININESLNSEYI